MTRRLNLFMTVLFGLSMASGQCAPGLRIATDTSSDAEVIALWVKDRQYDNAALRSFGGIRVHSTPAAIGADGRMYYRVSPYLGNLGVIGLLGSRFSFRLQVAEHWITWFLTHLTPESAPDGVPYEHFYLADGSGETTCVMPGDPHLCHYNDATDSAAATFFRVLMTYAARGGRRHFLASGAHKRQVERMAEDLLALQQPDGLAWAKTTYPVKYLEDNCEVYDGLRALARLEETIFNDTAQAQRYSRAADRVKKGILRDLYDPLTKHYFVAKFQDGARPAADLNTWYPDMQAQMWPHLFGVVANSDARTRSAITALNRTWNGGAPLHMNWATSPERVNGGWINADVAYAALVGGDKHCVAIYLRAVKALKYPVSTEKPHFAWPFTPADAGWLLKALSR